MSRSSNRRYVGAGCLLALALAGCGGGGPVSIGVAANFDDPLSAPIRYGAQLAVEEINAQGGVRGRQIRLIEKEDHGITDSAVAVAGDLYRSDAVAVIGHGFSGPTLAAAPVYNGGEHPLAQLAPAASAPAISQAGDYTFRLCPTDLAHGAALARWSLGQLGFRRGGVLYLNDEYGRGIRAAFVQEFVRLGGRLTQVDPYLGDTPDVGPYLDRLAREGQAQFLIVAGYDSEAAEILRQLRLRNLNIPVLGGDGLEQINGAGRVAEGTYATTNYHEQIGTEANRRFVRAYRARFPDAGAPNGAAAASYDAIYLLRDIIGRVGVGRAAIRNALADVGRGRPAFEGVTGRIAFDRNGDVSEQRVYLTVVRDGRMQLAEGQ